METSEIIFTILLVLSMAFNAFAIHVNHKLAKIKKELLDHRLDQVKKMQIPSLHIIQMYFTERENYHAAQLCKELIEEQLEVKKETP